MIQKVDMYTVLCDGCGKNSCDGTEYSAWSDKNFAEDQAMEDNWLKHDEKHYCPDCYSYDDDDNLILKTPEKKKESLKEYFKRWNWSVFVVIILVCIVEALGNKSTKTFNEGLLLVLSFGLPAGIFLAWLTKDEIENN